MSLVNKAKVANLFQATFFVKNGRHLTCDVVCLYMIINELFLLRVWMATNYCVKII